MSGNHRPVARDDRMPDRPDFIALGRLPRMHGGRRFVNLRTADRKNHGVGSSNELPVSAPASN